MTTLHEYNRYGTDLERIVKLKTSPVAVKMLESETDIPEGALRPERDRGIHIAQCQAFAMSRREGATVAMLKEDHWCFAPLIAYGITEKPDDPSVQRFVSFPTFEMGKYVGMVTAPLKTASFIPDIVLIYSDSAQLRDLLSPSHFLGQEPVVDSHFFPPSCAYTIVPVMENGRYLVALPDPGEHMRALAGSDEVILSLPAAKLETLMGEIEQYAEMRHGSISTLPIMKPDFDQPPLYKKMFKDWGLSSDD